MLSKLFLPALGIVIVILISKKRSSSWRDDLGLRSPGPLTLMAWLGFWILWIVFSEVIIRHFGFEQPKAWPAYPALILVLRILAIGIVGPFCEEIITRGILFYRLKQLRLGAWGAIVLISLIWAAAHYNYPLSTLMMIFADGFILGLARYKSGSLWIPVAMHTLGNLISISQSLMG